MVSPPEEEIKKEIEKVRTWYKDTYNKGMTYGCEYRSELQRWDFLISIDFNGIPKYLPFYLYTNRAYDPYWFPQIRDQLFPSITKAIRKEMESE